MSSADHLLALDVGTQSVRALLFDPRGTLVAMGRVAVEPYVAPNPGWAEQDPEVWWNAIGEACRRLWASFTLPVVVFCGPWQRPSRSWREFDRRRRKVGHLTCLHLDELPHAEVVRGVALVPLTVDRCLKRDGVRPRGGGNHQRAVEQRIALEEVTPSSDVDIRPERESPWYGALSAGK